MGSIQSVDPKSVFCFVGDFNCHHSEWLESCNTDAHGVAAFDFAPIADCSQLVSGPTHRAGGVLDLVLTNVPDLCDVHVHGNVGKSDHASLGVVLNLSPVVAGFGGRTICMRTIGMRSIGMEDNWHVENWHGIQLALTFLILSYLIILMF